ncbi:hypothetical protein [Baekduia sp.]|uniref:YncE family protein n=1 Tax=Baekduia sp. TaxID=2600305 RepID=UPI002DF75B0E|nr:hypothetical protein [Baekduia sp.]
MVAAALAAVALVGCGSAAVGELPPAAGPARAPVPVTPPAGRVVAFAGAPAALLRAASAEPSSVVSGRTQAVLAGRERALALVDPRTRQRIAHAAAGVGPTHVAAVADRLYVTDTRGGALLVFATRPQLALVRRVFLPGGPYAIAVDPVRHRLWVTLTARNEVVSLPANGRPRPVARLATVRQPVGVAVDPARGVLAVRGRDASVLQLVDVRRAG